MKRVTLPVTVGIIAMACVVFAFAFLAILIIPLKLDPIYRTGVDLVKNDPAVIELFGSPVKDSLFVIGTTKGYLDGSEVANLQVSISGPRAHGTVYIYGNKNGDGVVCISSISIEIERERVLEYSSLESEKGFQCVE